MGHTMIDSALFRDFCGTERAREIWSDENMLAKWLEYWAALAQAEEEFGIIPNGVSAAIRNVKVSDFDLDLMHEKIMESTHPCIPAIWQLEKICPNGLGKWVHWGATLQDLTDTTFVLQMRETSYYYEEVLTGLIQTCLDLAKKYRDTPMVGRTHQMHAVPITFGEKCAIYADELSRSLERLRECRSRLFKVEFFGAAGTLATLVIDGYDALAVQKRLAEILGLAQPTAPWHVARDTFGEFASIVNVLCSSISRMCFDLVGMHKQEVGEIEEDFPMGRLGSSTMPQKRNPDFYETLMGMNWVVNGLTTVAINCQHPQHERCTACMMADWWYIPSLYITAASIIEGFKSLLDTIHVYPERMLRNINLTRGGVTAEAMMIELGHKIGRMDAHEVVYESAMKSYEQERDLADCLLEDPRVTSVFSEEEVRKILTPLNYIGVAPKVVDNVIDTVSKKL